MSHMSFSFCWLGPDGLRLVKIVSKLVILWNCVCVKLKRTWRVGMSGNISWVSDVVGNLRRLRGLGGAASSGAVEMTICWLSVMKGWQRCTNLLAASRNSDTDSMHSTVFSIQIAAECADVHTTESLNFDSLVPWFHSSAFCHYQNCTQLM